MTTNATSGQESDAPTADHHRDAAAVEKRVHRALDNFFHVEPADDGEYTVYSGSGNTYTVDLSDGSCTCPDGQRSPWCKHAYRVAFITGDVPNIDGVHVATADDENNNSDEHPMQNNDAEDTLAERVREYSRRNPDASTITALAQLGIHPDKQERVEEVLAE